MRLIAVLLFALMTTIAFADNHGGREAMKGKMEAACAENPEQCEAAKAKSEEAKAMAQSKCEENPEQCDDMKAKKEEAMGKASSMREQMRQKRYER